MGDTYTHGHHESVLRSHTWRTAENSAGYLLAHLRPGLDLLDVGCGPGTITLDLAARVAPGRVRGVDVSADVIEQARASADGRAEFAVDDAYHLDLPDASFDVVHAHQVLQHLTDPVAAAAEWRRVLRPGGLLAVRDSDYAGFFWAPADPRLDRWLALYHELTAQQPGRGRRRTVAAGVVAGRRVRRPHRHQHDVDVRRPRDPGLVGRPVGRPRPAVVVRHPGRRVRPVRRRRAGAHRGRLAGLGRRSPTPSSSPPTSRSSPASPDPEVVRRRFSRAGRPVPR